MAPGYSDVCTGPVKASDYRHLANFIYSIYFVYLGGRPSSLQQTLLTRLGAFGPKPTPMAVLQKISEERSPSLASPII
jgi:hypothetical protein